MDYKYFHLQCVLRVVILSLTITLLVFLLLSTQFWVTSLFVGALGIWQIVALIRYVEKTNTQLTRFLLSITYSDFSQTFTNTLKGSGFEELNAAFNEVIRQFQRVRMEKEEHARYLQTIVDHVGVALMAFNSEGQVELCNNAARRLLRISHLKHITDLDAVYADFAAKLSAASPGGTYLFKLLQDGGIIQLSVHATAFILHQQHYKLAAMYNIQHELEEKEMEAWQNLIRVLTHEIMNSITPISSLASTARILLQQDVQDEDVARGKETLSDIREAVATIEKRSQGLLIFIENYRKLTRIPTPQLTIIPVKELFERIRTLMHEQFERYSITFTMSLDPESLEITADQALIEQVLLNLCKNALEAVSGSKTPEIQLRAETDNFGRPVIQVVDNGPGIKEELVEKIFIPFFTTKPQGSGIGLSLSRQIMRLHKGTLSVTSQSERDTVFSLRF